MLAFPPAPATQAATGVSEAAGNHFKVAVDAVANGRFSVDPPVSEDGKVAAGTVLTLDAEPES